MVVLNTSRDSNQGVVETLIKYLEENSLKYMNYDHEKRSLVCNDGSRVLQRKIALNLKLNVPTKCVFVHAYDPTHLFLHVIKPAIVDVLKEYNSIDIYIVSSSPAEYVNQSSSALNIDNNASIYLISSNSELEQRIHSDKGDRKIVLNFEPTCRYVRSDVFVYFCFLTSSEEVSKMFHLGPNDTFSKNIVIDTLVQSCTTDVSFLGSERNDLTLQNCTSFYILKNCPDSSKRVFQLVNDLVFAASQDGGDKPDVLQDDGGEDEDEDEIDMKIQHAINTSIVGFTDFTEQQSYMVNFMKLYLGHIKNIYSVDSAWWTVSRCTDFNRFKIAIFTFSRSVPNFNTITAFVNAWKHSNRLETNKKLMCLILVSPVISLSTREALLHYNNNFHWLLKMASSANCCEGLHCDKILKKQFMVNNTACSDSPSNLENVTVLELVMKIFEDVENWVKTRENSQNPIFHENEMLNSLRRYDRTIAEAITASYLYRGIPLLGKDGKQKVCVRLCNRNDLFIVKNDYQKHVNLSTITGILFENTVNTLLNEMNEEYRF